MIAFAAFGWVGMPEPRAATDSPRKPDWPLMSDVATVRAGVPEALIRWRAARGETAPEPCDPVLRRD